MHVVDTRNTQYITKEEIMSDIMVKRRFGTETKFYKRKKDDANEK